MKTLISQYWLLHTAVTPPTMTPALPIKIQPERSLNITIPLSNSVYLHDSNLQHIIIYKHICTINAHLWVSEYVAVS